MNTSSVHAVIFPSPKTMPCTWNVLGVLTHSIGSARSERWQAHDHCWKLPCLQRQTGTFFQDPEASRGRCLATLVLENKRKTFYFPFLHGMHSLFLKRQNYSWCYLVITAIFLRKGFTLNSFWQIFICYLFPLLSACVNTGIHEL